MLVVQVDVVGTESLQGAFDRGLDVCGAAVRVSLTTRVVVEAELRGDDDAVPTSLEGTANDFLAEERPVDLGRVDVALADVEGGASGIPRLLGIDLEDAESQLGDVDAVGQADGGNR